MAFYASHFTFDGVPCSKFDLEVYELSDMSHGDGSYAGVVSVIDEQMIVKPSPLFYGVQFEDKLTFSFVFGLNNRRIDIGEPMTRMEMDDIATWLIGHDSYKYLTFEQSDLFDIRFKCMITGLEPVTYGQMPWAMKATVMCDSPYAYRMPETFSFIIDGERTVTVNNRSSHHGYYRPVIEFISDSGCDLKIVNETDNSRTISFSDVPLSVTNWTLNNDTMVLTNSAGLNIYDNFNKKSFRLKRGINRLKISGHGTLKIYCEFYANVCG